MHSRAYPSSSTLGYLTISHAACLHKLHEGAKPPKPTNHVRSLEEISSVMIMTDSLEERFSVYLPLSPFY
jgi:hypothetical protein